MYPLRHANLHTLGQHVQVQDTHTHTHTLLTHTEWCILLCLCRELCVGLQIAYLERKLTELRSGKVTEKSQPRQTPKAMRTLEYRLDRVSR